MLGYHPAVKVAEATKKKVGTEIINALDLESSNSPSIPPTQPELEMQPKRSGQFRFLNSNLKGPPFAG